MAKITLALSLLFVLSIFSGCAFVPLQAQSAPATAAPTASFNCTAPALIRGHDDGEDNAYAVYTLCAVGNAPSTGGFYSQEVVYTLEHDFVLSQVSTWMGTSQKSIEETDADVAIEVPTGIAGKYKIVALITNQKDKHTDVEGERIEHFQNGIYHLPAGSRIHFFMNIGIIDPDKNCPLGCAVQLNVYMNGAAS